ncbi:MAG: HAD-IB family phosphatase, partial [Candidatus Bathyarchaeia archaeon]
LKDCGFKTGIVTDSYQFLAERLAKKLGVDLIYGNAVELREGVFTGKLVIRYPCMNIPNCRKYSLCKRRVLLKLKEKICGVSVAVGDSGSDICMVQAADIGIAYNPTSAQLMNLAKFTVFSFEELERILRPYFTF